MAREFARIKLSLWTDPTFAALPASAQRLYLLLVSSDLSGLGVTAYVPRRWARHAPDTLEDDVVADVERLAGARMIVVDVETAELLVRTYVRHDRSLNSPKTAKGALSSFATIASPRIVGELLAVLEPRHLDRAFADGFLRPDVIPAALEALDGHPVQAAAAATLAASKLYGPTAAAMQPGSNRDATSKVHRDGSEPPSGGQSTSVRGQDEDEDEDEDEKARARGRHPARDVVPIRVPVSIQEAQARAAARAKGAAS